RDRRRHPARGPRLRRRHPEGGVEGREPPRAPRSRRPRRPRRAHRARGPAGDPAPGRADDHRDATRIRVRARGDRRLARQRGGGRGGGGWAGEGGAGGGGGGGGDAAVVIPATFGRPGRRGLTDVAIGVAGLAAVVALRGETDSRGRALRVTEVAVGDEVAGAA